MRTESHWRATQRSENAPMPVPAATTPAPSTTTGRRVPALLGAVFVGSTLVATLAPAHAAPTPVTFSFARASDTIELGEAAPANPVLVSNQGDLTICLVELKVDDPEYRVQGFEGIRIEPDTESLSVGSVSGAPRDDDMVTATLTYALANEESGTCDGSSETNAVSATWSIEVTEPEPSPTPTPTPTEEPTGSPSPTPTPTEEPTKSPSPTPTPTPTPPRSPSPTPTETPTETPSQRPTEDVEAERPSATSSPPSSHGPPTSPDRGSPGQGSPGQGSPDRTPPRSDVPTSGTDLADLPRTEADLPDLAPGEAEDLADLPLVTPTSEEDDTETEIAADHDEMGSSVTPAILLAAFLLALLLAAPVAPARRVRLGLSGGYQGKRRKG